MSNRLFRERFHHTWERLRQRYGITITLVEYKRLCAMARSGWVEGEIEKSDGNKLMLIRCHGELVLFGYRVKDKLIATAMPMSRWEDEFNRRMQQSLPMTGT